jgi:hypothetical protein
LFQTTSDRRFGSTMIVFNHSDDVIIRSGTGKDSDSCVSGASSITSRNSGDDQAATASNSMLLDPMSTYFTGNSLLNEYIILRCPGLMYV